MKTCTKCGLLKETTEFYSQKDRKDGASFCKSCFNTYCTDRWIQRKKEAVNYKGGSCIKCGYDTHYAALQFHHRDPSTKDVNWAQLRLRSWDKITLELDKCDLLCANCHSVHHSKG